MQKTIKTEQIEMVRAMMAGDFIRKEENCYSYQGELGPDGYCNLIGLDYDTVCLLGHLSYTITYLRTIENKYQLACMTYIDGIMNDKLSVNLEDDIDFLGLYSEKADSSLENFFNDSLENVVRKLKETYPDVVESIEQSVISNIREYDLYDSDKEHFAECYIKENPVSSVEMAEDYLTEEEQTDIVKDWSDCLSSEDTKDLIVKLVDTL